MSPRAALRPLALPSVSQIPLAEIKAATVHDRRVLLTPALTAGHRHPGVATNTERSGNLFFGGGKGRKRAELGNKEEEIDSWTLGNNGGMTVDCCSKSLVEAEREGWAGREEKKWTS